MKDAYQIIEQPLVTEKSVSGAGQGKYTFRVSRDSNKIEIAQAIEKRHRGVEDVGLAVRGGGRPPKPEALLVEGRDREDALEELVCRDSGPLHATSSRNVTAPRTSII